MTEKMLIKDDGYTLEIEGIRYAYELFRSWGVNGVETGTLFRLDKREDGVLTITTLKNDALTKERDALRERVERLTTALEVIGNEAGSPTMDYEQKIENRELRSSRTRIYKMVRKALSIPEGER